MKSVTETVFKQTNVENRERFSELKSCVKIEVDVFGSLSLAVLTVVSVDVKQH